MKQERSELQEVKQERSDGYVEVLGVRENCTVSNSSEEGERRRVQHETQESRVKQGRNRSHRYV